ncbi:MAG: ApaG domain, partial [Gammaproteobacteria bacterium]
MTRKTHDIRVSAEAVYLPDQSLPEQQRYAFAYTITISNTGAVAATLLGRHWIITDANG